MVIGPFEDAAQKGRKRKKKRGKESKEEQRKRKERKEEERRGEKRKEEERRGEERMGKERKEGNDDKIGTKANSVALCEFSLMVASAM